MKKFTLIIAIIGLGLVSNGNCLFAQEEDAVVETAGVEASEEVSAPQEVGVLFSFEKNVEGWEIPDWCYEKDDYVGQQISRSDKFASEGNSSLELLVDYPGGIWTAAYTEIMQYLDLTGAKAVAVDLYIPEDAPNGLKAKMIVTVGEDWVWTEMSRSVKLEPGKWVTIEADLTDDSMSWRGTAVDDEFRGDIRKLGVRIESNMRPVYSGALYIDNIRVIK